MKTLLKIVVTGTAVMHLTACSKTVQWEEEVPLNTGEVIWVKRTVEYTMQGGAGNPFDIAYRPVRGSVAEFKWRSKHYAFDLHGGVMVLAISPEGQPVLVTEADAGSWDAANYYQCTIPFYVQFVPDATGCKWTWPPRIDAWLYNVKSNFLLAIPTLDKGKRRYTADERKAANFPGLVQRPSRQKLDPAYTGDRCKPKVIGGTGADTFTGGNVNDYLRDRIGIDFMRGFGGDGRLWQKIHCGTASFSRYSRGLPRTCQARKRGLHPQSQAGKADKTEAPCF